jgi:hypothetical protein
LDEARRRASGFGDCTDAVEAAQGGAAGVDVMESPADGALDDIAWRPATWRSVNMVSTAFVMVSTIAFMDGEEGTEAMVEAYSGESPTIFW